MAHVNCDITFSADISIRYWINIHTYSVHTENILFNNVSEYFRYWSTNKNSNDWKTEICASLF